MCGINGFNFVDKRKLKKMNQSIAHRGPDNDGMYFNKNVSLGHRRLSILDLSSAGNQPMHYKHKNKEAIIVFNGEIYNFQKIRDELKKQGYKFKSECDTEVILASYLEWGTDCVKRFNGMWAFCIYDPHKSLLFLSRDRLGQKPIYYYHDKKRFIFSSEIKGILEHEIDLEINREAVDLYLTLSFIPSPYSIYKGISKVEARQNLILHLKSNFLEKEYYYAFPKYAPQGKKSALIKEGKELIKDSSKLRLISDVPLGAFLSGGIDSSTIVHEMTKQIERSNLNTFSIGFEGKYDETPYVKIAKNLFKTKHHHKYYTEKDFKSQKKDIFFYYDEPFADPSMFPTIDLSKFARKSLTVALSGDGGDEIFGGYPRHQKARHMSILRSIPLFLRKIIYPFSSGSLKEGIRLSFLPKEKIFSEARQNIYKPKIFREISERKMKESLVLSGGNLEEAVLYYDRYFQTLADNYLCKVDRASMAHGLEVRSPFLDYRFMEYSSKIPTKYKFGLRKNKILLREIASEFLPKRITKRKKTGFTPPIESWLLKKEYREELKNILDSLHEKGIISAEWYVFFRREVFKKKGIIYQNFLIKLYLLNEWLNYWQETIKK